MKEIEDRIARLNVTLAMFDAGKCYFSPYSRKGRLSSAGPFVLRYKRERPSPKFNYLIAQSRFKTIEAMEAKIHKVTAYLTNSR